MICPKCKENTAHRSERSGILDNAANRVFIKPYTCSDCRHRFYAFRKDVGWAAVREETGRYLKGYSPGREGRRNRRELLIYGVGVLMVVAVIYYIAQQRE